MTAEHTETAEITSDFSASPAFSAVKDLAFSKLQDCQEGPLDKFPPYGIILNI